jgi:betaine-aldehyde dehydrogenase
MITYDKLYIGGQWVAPSSNAKLDVVSPHSEEIIGRAPEAKEADIDRAVAAARDAFDNGPWQWTPPNERADLMEKLAARGDAPSSSLRRSLRKTAARFPSRRSARSAPPRWYSTTSFN